MRPKVRSTLMRLSYIFVLFRIYVIKTDVFLHAWLPLRPFCFSVPEEKVKADKDYVMISYNWADKEVVMSLKDQLVKNGIKVRYCTSAKMISLFLISFLHRLKH